MHQAERLYSMTVRMESALPDYMPGMPADSAYSEHRRLRGGKGGAYLDEGLWMKDEGLFVE
jgi:hypothetical protein